MKKYSISWIVSCFYSSLIFMYLFHSCPKYVINVKNENWGWKLWNNWGLWFEQDFAEGNFNAARTVNITFNFVNPFYANKRFILFGYLLSETYIFEHFIVGNVSRVWQQIRDWIAYISINIFYIDFIWAE